MEGGTGSPRGDSDQGLTFPLPEGKTGEGVAPAAPALGAGETLASRYRIVRFIARGGGGEVYEAEDLELGGRVALKTLIASTAGDATRIERFRREIQLSRQVTDPHVCRIYDLGRHTYRTEAGRIEAVLFLTMELLGGTTLANHLEDGGALSVEEALPIVRQMVQALGAAHRAGVIHRDFKSGNVMLVPDPGGATIGGAGMRIVVTDFGLARATFGAERLTPTMTASGLIVGSPAYMAPEQVEGGPIGPAADVYALGVVLYEMLTGAFPFQGDSALSLAVKRLHEPPIPLRDRLPAVDPRWERVILRCLERDPEARFAAVEEVAAALEPDAPMPRRQWLRGLARRRWAVAAALAATLLGAGGLATYRKLSAPSLAKPAAPAVAQLPAPVPAAQPRRAVAILGFENLSGKAELAWLATAFSEMIATELASGQTLRTVPGETVARVRRELGIERTTGLAPLSLARLRTGLAADFIVLGAYFAQGQDERSRLRLDVHLQDAATGEAIRTLRREDDAAQLFRLASAVGDDLRQALGAGPAAGHPANLSLPAHPEAARLYSEGLAALRGMESLAARQLLERAVALEPGHPGAQSALAQAWSQLGYETRAEAAAKLAFEASAGLPEDDRQLIEARYRAMSHDWDRAIGLYSGLRARHPDDGEQALRLTKALLDGGRTKEALRVCQETQEAVPGARGDPVFGIAEAEVYQKLNDWARSVQAAEGARAIAEKNGARGLVARSYSLAGWAHHNLGEPAVARRELETAESLFRALGDLEGVALAHRSIAVLLRRAGDLEGAYGAASEALATLRKIGNQRHALVTLNSLANIRYQQDRLAAATDLYGEALSVAREIGDARAQAALLGNLGNSYYATGQLARAIGAQREALRLKREIGDRGGIATTLVSLSTALLDSGEPAEARVGLEEALATTRELGEKALEADALQVLGELLHERGDDASARDSIARAAATREAAGDAAGHFESRLWQTRLAMGTQPAAASIQSLDALASGSANQQPQLLALLFGALAEAQLAAGDPAAARQAAQRARGLAEQTETRSGRWPALSHALRVEGLAGGDREHARRELEALRRDAEGSGFLRYALQARLDLIELAPEANPADRGAQLEALTTECRRRGFERLALDATALAQGIRRDSRP